MWRIYIIATTCKPTDCGAKKKKKKSANKWIWATASKTDRQKHWVLSMYSVHRKKNPQCVLANITQLLSDWFSNVRVSGRALCCRTSPPTPTHRHWNHCALTTEFGPGVRSSNFFFFWHSHAQRSSHYKWMVVCGKREQLAFGCWAVWRGTGGTVSFIYNQVRSLWLNVVTARESKSKLRHSREVTNLPVLCRVKLI